MAVALFDIFALETNLYKMEKPHAHKKQLLEMQKLYAEYNSAVANKLPDEDVELRELHFTMSATTTTGWTMLWRKMVAKNL